MKKCEAESIKMWYGNCGKPARFKIVDYECGKDWGYKGFWVCNECIKHFIDKNEDDPHYILLEEKK